MDSTLIHGVVTFLLGGQAFGLPVGTVREVVPNAWLDQPPHMPTVVEGILNLGGRAVPVLRLDRLLGVDDCRFGIDASILVMRDDGPGAPVLGLLVDHVDGVRSADYFTTMDFPDRRSFNGCLTDQLECVGGTVFLLDWRKILLAEEKIRVAEFGLAAQARLAALGNGGP